MDLKKILNFKGVAGNSYKSSLLSHFASKNALPFPKNCFRTTSLISVDKKGCNVNI